MRAFFSMGGYGFYVWGSYALALAVVVGQAIAARVRLRRLERAVGTGVDSDES